MIKSKYYLNSHVFANFVGYNKEKTTESNLLCRIEIWKGLSFKFEHEHQTYHNKVQLKQFLFNCRLPSL